LTDGSLGLIGLRAFTRCFSCINALGFAKKLLKEGLLESSFHKPFRIEKGEGDNFALSNRFLEKNLFSKELSKTFAIYVLILPFKIILFSLINGFWEAILNTR
jgi:hypothetical protein